MYGNLHPGCASSLDSSTSTRAALQDGGGKGDTKILCLAVAPNGKHVLSGTDNGSLRVWDSQKGTLQKDLKGHVMGINTVNVFPSSTVCLSGGQDMQLRVFSLKDGKCYRQMKGHTRSITGSCIIGVGKHVVSCGGDSLVKLWECSSGKALRTIKTSQDDVWPLNGCCLLPRLATKIEMDTPTSTGDVVLVASEGNSIQAFDLRASSTGSVWTTRTSGAANTVIARAQGTGVSKGKASSCDVAVGTQDGYLHLMDSRQTSKGPVVTARRSDGAVTCIRWDSTEASGGVWAADAVGACSLWNFNARVKDQQMEQPMIRA